MVRGVPDEAAHSLAYLIFSLTLVWGWTSGFRKELSAPGALLLWIGAVLYGISDEFHQSFVSGRTPAMADLLADAVGALAAISGSWLLLRPRQ